MKSRYTKIIFCLLLTFIFTPFAFSRAQFTENPNEIPASLSYTPDNPGPHQDVTLKITTYMVDIDTSTITWYVNGSRKASGKGMNTFTTTLGDNGTVSTVKATLNAANGQSVTQSVKFQPGTVSLVWESASYVPPFYKGKAQVGPYSQVRIIALPQFKAGSLNQNNYTFTWTQNGRIIGSQSGYGKNSLIITSPLDGMSTNVGVTVSSGDESLKASNSITITSVQPQVVVYPYSQIYGPLYNQAVGSTYALTSKEVSFSAVPYFINVSTQTPVAFTWLIDNKTTTNKSTITIRNDSGARGETSISVRANDGTSNATSQKEFRVTY